MAIDVPSFCDVVDRPHYFVSQTSLAAALIAPSAAARPAALSALSGLS